ncbi:MAG: OPT/YSL family transporter [Phycisphaeraceae bacterium]|nr:MAG: OPT/YSL family transporter [Phycisphaeraceae bacterium]
MSMPPHAQAASSPTPVDFTSPQLTWKALMTGMILGAVLSICNVYTGLKIGWGINMSITGILLAFAFWRALSLASARRVGMLGPLENNVNQSAVSAAGAVSSAGLVSAIPALTILEGVTLAWWQLVAWISTVCFVGIAVAMGLRRQMIIRDGLAFPSGTACAQTIREVYGRGSEAMRRVSMLGAGAVGGAAFKLAEILKWTRRSDLGVTINGSSAATYSFALDPTLLMVAVGGLVGPRTGVSVLLGAVLGWGVLGVWLVDSGRVGATRASIGDWILWPGVTLMVVASLVSFSFSLPSILRSFRWSGAGAPSEDTGEVPRRWFFVSMIVALILAVFLQGWFFGIAWWAGVAAVLLSFVLAVVASRVSGETNVTPVGPMGKVTQLAFAALMPKSAAANLMSASVTAGAASQCADLMHDLKCGYLLGGVARRQVVAQILGSIAGALVGCAFYLVLVPDPKTMLMTEAWPAPAVAQWKAVAEVFREGFHALPAGVPIAMLLAAFAGVVLPVLERVLPKKAGTWVPSAAAVGLAFVIPGSNSLSMFLGGAAAFVLTKMFPNWSGRYLVTVCAGIVAGESLTGAGDAIRLVLAGVG